MADSMTIEEMEARFPSEWLLIGDPETDEIFSVRRGLVLHHIRDRNEAYRTAVKLRPRRFAMHYTGTIPEGAEVIL